VSGKWGYLRFLCMVFIGKKGGVWETMYIPFQDDSICLIYRMEDGAEERVTEVSKHIKPQLTCEDLVYVGIGRFVRRVNKQQPV
jgi:hypothetical protein